MNSVFIHALLVTIKSLLKDAFTGLVFSVCTSAFPYNK